MVYEKNTWQSGDVITSAKLNNMESGLDTLNHFIIGIQIVSMPEEGSPGTVTVDKTLAEVQEAHAAGKRVFINGMIGVGLEAMGEVTAFLYETMYGRLVGWTATLVTPGSYEPGELMVIQGDDEVAWFHLINTV